MAPVFIELLSLNKILLLLLYVNMLDRFRSLLWQLTGTAFALFLMCTVFLWGKCPALILQSSTNYFILSHFSDLKPFSFIPQLNNSGPEKSFFFLRWLCILLLCRRILKNLKSFAVSLDPVIRVKPLRALKQL